VETERSEAPRPHETSRRNSLEISVSQFNPAPAILLGVKPLTRTQLQGRKAKAVRFTRDVLGDPDPADEIEAESLEDYAERRKVTLINPSHRRKLIMPSTTKTKADLEAEISDLQDENQELQNQLDVIADIVAPADDDEDEDEDSDSDDDSDDDDGDEDPD
jgi:hypothetical protein